MEVPIFDLKQFILDCQDFLAPRLDMYEQAIYLYAFRHSRLIDQDQVVIGFKSARRRMAYGVGAKGTPMADRTAYGKLKSLQAKGCIQIVASERNGTRIRVNLPSEIPGAIPDEVTPTPPNLETMDYFSVTENRSQILEREGHRCFYCICSLDSSNHVIEHVISRPAGDNSYRNVVASCRQCNNRKGASTADDWLRTLYREGYLHAPEFEDRVKQLARLRAGELRPPK